jgi:signal peptidase I
VGWLVVFRAGGGPDEWVKRVVDVAGDTVQVKAGVVYVNNQPAAREPLGDYAVGDGDGLIVQAHEYRETLPGGGTHLILKYSDEGRYDAVNQVDANNTDAYTVPEGTVFMLGDNRDNSMDSRYPSVGFVPVGRIIGVADVLYWAHDRGRIGMRVE